MFVFWFQYVFLFVLSFIRDFVGRVLYGSWFIAFRVLSLQGCLFIVCFILKGLLCLASFETGIER